MSGIRSALDEWLAEDVEGLSVDRLADLVELERISGLVEAVRAQRLAVFAGRDGHHAHGFPSATAFLKFRCGMGSGRAHRLVARAHTLLRTVDVSAAWIGGRVSTDQTELLLRMAGLVPDRFVEVEETLIDAVDGLTVSETRRLLEYWRQSVDGPGVLSDEETITQQRGVSVSETFEGTGRLDGTLTPRCRQTLAVALDALMPPPDPDDGRTPRQRRHDALEDLARYYLDHTDTPQVGGERPHLNIVCDLPALQGVAGGIHETETGQVITIPELRMLACDAAVSRIVLGADSEIIDVGHRTRTIPTGLRRGLIVRDRHCTWPGGCDRNPQWCDVHHDTHWADHGPTNPANCRLLCRYHHTLTHQIQETPRPPPDP